MRDGRFPHNIIHPDGQSGKYPHSPAFLKTRRGIPSLPVGGDYSWWKHDEGAGAVATDSGPLANNGTIRGAGFWGDFAPDGVTPVGAYGGANDVNALTDPVVNTADHLVLMAVVKPDAGADQMILARAHPANGYNYQFYFWHAGGGLMDFVFYYLSAGPVNEMWGGADTPFVANLWYIIVFYYKMGTGGTAKMWINGMRRTGMSWVAGDGDQAPLLGGAQHLHIGSYDIAGDDTGIAWPFGGNMKDILLWPDFGREFTEIDAQVAFNFLRGGCLL